MSGPIVIGALRPDDWERVRAIYVEGIATGHATFETGAPPWEKWDADHLPQARLVAREGPEILGWAAARDRGVGRRERLGKLGGVWRDIVLLERRSSTVGSG